MDIVDNQIRTITGKDQDHDEEKGAQNDNSNPQQGSGNSVEQGKAGSRDNKNKESKDSQDVPPRRILLKIPPTAKDPRKLFVGGLPADVTNDEFQTYFAQFGEVLDCVVMFDRETQRSRGFGFVTFQDPSVCDYILSLGQKKDFDNNGSGGPKQPRSRMLEMRGKTIEVKEAEPKIDAGMGRNNGRRFGRGSSAHSSRPNPIYAPLSTLPMNGQPYVWPSTDPYGYSGYVAPDAAAIQAPYVVPPPAVRGCVPLSPQLPAYPPMYGFQPTMTPITGVFDGHLYQHSPYPYDYGYAPVAYGSVPVVVPPESSVMQPAAPGIHARGEDCVDAKGNNDQGSN